MSVNQIFIDEYLSRQKTALNVEKTEFQYNNMYSVKAADAAFDYMSILIEETRKFLFDKGFDIDRISIVAIHDVDMPKKDKKCEKISFDHDVILRVVRLPNDELEATLFLGSWSENS